MKGRTPSMQRESAGEILVDSGAIAVAAESGLQNINTDVMAPGGSGVAEAGFMFHTGSGESDRYPVVIVRDDSGQVRGVEVVLGSTTIEHEASAALGMLGLEPHDGMWASTMSSVCQTLWRNVAEREPDGELQVRGTFESTGMVFVGDPWRGQLAIEVPAGTLEAVCWIADGWVTRLGVRTVR